MQEWPLKSLLKGQSFVGIYLCDPIYTSCVTASVLCTPDVQKSKVRMHLRWPLIWGAGYSSNRGHIKLFCALNTDQFCHWKLPCRRVKRCLIRVKSSCRGHFCVSKRLHIFHQAVLGVHSFLLHSAIQKQISVPAWFCQIVFILCF